MPELYIEYRETVYYQSIVEIDEDEVREWLDEKGLVVEDLADLTEDQLHEFVEQADWVMERAQDVAHEYDNGAAMVDGIKWVV